MMAVAHTDVDRWSAGDVKARMHEMGTTLKRTPGSNVELAELAAAVIYQGRDTPERMKTLQERWLERLGQEELKDTEEAVVIRIKPSPAEISRMEECITWFVLLRSVDERRAIWSWALGVGMRRLGRRLGMSRSAAHRLVLHALANLTAALNAR